MTETNSRDYGVLHLGREEIARIHAAAFASRFQDTKLRMTVQYFSVLARTMAVAHVRATAITASTESQAIRAMVTTVLSNKSGVASRCVTRFRL